MADNDTTQAEGGFTMMHYILDDNGDPVEEPNMIAFAQWMESNDHVIASDHVGDAHVSTVFLGINHAFGFNAEPVLFETMVFGGAHDQYQERYTTRQEAIDGHKRVLAMARTQLTDRPNP